jgi:starvation-inducible DNA-binding protein
MADLKILQAVKPMEDDVKPAKSMDKILQDLVNEMYSFYFKLHKYHWNVTGQNFFDLHSMFGDMYDDVHDAIDKTAEYIRILGVMADIKPEVNPGNAKGDMQMVSDVLKANKALLESLKAAEEAADYYEHCDMENFMADRIDIHNKWAWQLTSFKG